MSTLQQSYEVTPYPGFSHSQTHPNRLATNARLVGLDTPPVSRCRVLELGCAGGGNLIPMAYNLPETEFVGVDFAPGQIAAGREIIAELGLANITLHRLDILDMEPDFGQFDYIIAHGVYSWTPPPVRDKLLQICRQNLAPSGVAYVSYNVYPGWHSLEMMRHMMLYHIQLLEDPQQRAYHARDLIGFLTEVVPQDTLYGMMLSQYQNMLKGEHKDDSFLLHDELEEINTPLYFHQFMAHIEQHELQYMTDANFHKMFPNDFSPKVTRRLQKMVQSSTDLEQYLDFLRNNTFRQSLLCHREVNLLRRLEPERVKDCYISSRAKPVAEKPNIPAKSVEEFEAPNETKLSTDHPVSKAAMVHLQQIWPRSIHFEALLAKACLEIYGREPEPKTLATDLKALSYNLLRAYSYHEELIRLDVLAPARFVTEAGDRPEASPVARLQARRQATVTNQRHDRVWLDELDRRLLTLLDGDHDRSALVETLLASGKVTTKDSKPIRSRKLLKKELNQRLDWLAWAALLIN